MESYSIRVTKDYLVFCAAHFISYEKTRCERVHGHNYRVTAEVTAPLDENYLVLDFIEFKRILREITDELDHHVILPLNNPILKVEQTEDEVTVRYQDKKRWVFPREDCMLLDIHNTTAEELAWWVCERVLTELKEGGYVSPDKIAVDVEETDGQSARYERVLNR